MYCFLPDPDVHVHVHDILYTFAITAVCIHPSSFRQVYAQMKGNLMHLRELFARQLHENSMSTSEENARIKDDVMSAIMYSRREWVQGKENLQRELETRITALEEVCMYFYMTNLRLM